MISLIISYLSLAVSPGPLIINGVRASSIKIESTSSTIASFRARCP